MVKIGIYDQGVQKVMKKNNHTHEAKEKIASQLEHTINYIKNHARNGANQANDAKFKEFLDKAQPILEGLVKELSKFPLT